MHADAGIGKLDFIFLFFAEYIMNAESMLHVLFVHLYVIFTLVACSLAFSLVPNAHLQLQTSVPRPIQPIVSLCFISQCGKGNFNWQMKCLAS